MDSIRQMSETIVKDWTIFNESRDKVEDKHGDGNENEYRNRDKHGTEAGDRDEGDAFKWGVNDPLVQSSFRTTQLSGMPI